MVHYLGLDLGGTNIKAGVVDELARIVSKGSVPAEAAEGPERVVYNMVRVGREAVEKAALTMAEITAIGIGSPGPLSVERGVIHNSPNLPGFVNFPLRDRVAASLDAKAVLHNDANAAAFGEYWSGAGREMQHMVMFTLGTGIGGGVVSDGVLLRGCGDNAGELGHIIVHPEGRQCGCGQNGCLEAYASATHTVRRAEEAIAEGTSSTLSSLDSISAKRVAEHAQKGDALAIAVLDGAAEALALACVSLRHVVEPQLVVLGGGMAAAGELILAPTRKHYQRHMWKLQDSHPLRIKLASLGSDAGFIGAAGLAQQIFPE